MREVPALARGLRILDLLAAAGEPMRISEIASRLAVPRSATYELVNTLRLYQMVDQTTDGLVVLGAKLSMLGASFVQKVDLGRLSNEAVIALRDATDETVQIAVLDDRFVLYIAKADSSRQLRLVSNVGRRLPAHVTGLGKALLASLDDDVFERMFAGVELEHYTPTSIRTMAALRREVAQIRRNGYATDDGESTPEVRCVAAPVRDNEGRVVAAISISVPQSRVTPEREAAHVRNVVDAADSLSSRLGHLAAGAA